MEGGPPSFPQTHRGSWYSGYQSEDPDGLATGLSPSLARRSSLLACIVGLRPAGPTTPASLAKDWFGLLPVRSPLLGESRLIFLRRATEMFQFAHGPPPCLWVQQGVSRHHSGGVAPFGISGLMACMQLPRNVSPVSASFIGLQRQGIHPVLCRACVLDSGSPACLRVGYPHAQAKLGVMFMDLSCVCHPLLRFASCLLGKIEVILFNW